MALSFVAQSARGLGCRWCPQREVDKGRTIVERFMIRWRGEPDPRHVKAVDAYWVSAAEHGMNASTFTARVIASHRRRRRRLPVRRGRRDVRPAARRRARRACCTCSRRSSEPATRSATSRACSTAASG